MLTVITFLAAAVGYLGMAAVMVLSAGGRLPLGPWRGVALVIALHVGLVWIHRYEGQFSEATRNGYAGFVIFHAALLFILTSALGVGRHALLLARIAFLIVTAGALGAVFRYEEVAIYRVPIILGAVLGGFGILRATWARKAC